MAAAHGRGGRRPTEQQRAAEPAIHELAKPVARTLAWSAAGAAFAPLAAGVVRNLRGG